MQYQLNEQNPNTCNICYQNYSTEKKPFILINCGHSYCKFCIEKKVENNKIICFQCRIPTPIANNDVGKLPINRELLESISYINKIEEKEREKFLKKLNTLREEEIEKIILPENYSNIKEQIKDYQEIIDKFEFKINEIKDKYPYLGNLEHLESIEKVDKILDGLINKINNYREEIHKKIKSTNKFFFDWEETLNLSKAKIKNFNEIFNNEILNYKESEKEKLELENKIKNFPFFSDKIILNSIIENIEVFEKKFYSPNKILFTNEVQNDIISKELEKFLKKVCDYDENIQKFNIKEIKNFNTFIKEIKDCCLTSNTEKIKYIFDHYYLNPNYTYTINNDHNILENILRSLQDKEKLKDLIDYLIKEYNYFPISNYTFSKLISDSYSILYKNIALFK